MIQELECTNCGRFVRFEMDFEQDGNHEITCPECQHVHYRTVRRGRITDIRWRSSSQAQWTWTASTVTSTSAISIYASATSTATAALWLNGSWAS